MPPARREQPPEQPDPQPPASPEQAEQAAESAGAQAQQEAQRAAQAQGVTLTADQLEQIGDRAAQRTYELFERGGAFSHPEPQAPPPPPEPQQPAAPADQRPEERKPRSAAARFLEPYF